MTRLAGRRILIAGSATGIGRATAELFAAEGAVLALLDQNGAVLDELAARLGASSATLDVTDDAGVEAAVARVAAIMGGIDGVVYCAGIALRASLADTPPPAWRRVLEVNLTGAYLVIRACLPWLEKARDATIVTLSSAQGLLPNAANRTAYAASKGGLINLTRALAAELAPRVRVNCICPGLVDTPLIAGVPVNTDAYALGRVGTPAEVARAILFLTTDDASFVTGAALAVDGGRTFH